MRYHILKPVTPCDPRELAFDNLESLYEAMPKVDACDLEEDAMDSVRHIYPDAIAMPVPVKIGSGTSWMLGIIESVQHHVADVAMLRCPMFVQAVAERERERKLIATHGHWNRKIWKEPVLMPSGETWTSQVEVRATDLPQPLLVEATIGRARDGRPIIHCALGGIELSLAFSETDIQIVRPS